MKQLRKRPSSSPYPPANMPVLALNHRTRNLDKLNPLVFQSLMAQSVAARDDRPDWRNDPTYNLRRKK
jgi:hypothetical protein